MIGAGIFFVYLFCFGARDQTQDLSLVSQAVEHWAKSPVLFLKIKFTGAFLGIKYDSIGNLYLYMIYLGGIFLAILISSFHGWLFSSQSYFQGNTVFNPGWPQKCIHPASASQTAAGLTGMCHRAQLLFSVILTSFSRYFLFIICCAKISFS